MNTPIYNEEGYSNEEIEDKMSRKNKVYALGYLGLDSNIVHGFYVDSGNEVIFIEYKQFDHEITETELAKLLGAKWRQELRSATDEQRKKQDEMAAKMPELELKARKLLEIINGVINAKKRKRG